MFEGATEGFFIRDTGVYTRFLRPQGDGKCPLVVVFHGLPGTETNIDLAYALREAGYASLVPNYSGAWGSRGDYSIQAIPGNIKAVLDLAFDEEFAAKWGIDTGRVAVAGHSLGGWSAFISPRIDPRVRGIVALDPLVDPMFGVDPDAPGGNEEMLRFFKQMIEPLRGVTPTQLAGGMGWMAREWLPMNVISDLGDRFFMLLSASGKEGISMAPAMRLLEKVRTFNPGAEFWALNTDHGFTNCRPLMRQLVIEFLMRRL